MRAALGFLLALAGLLIVIVGAACVSDARALNECRARGGEPQAGAGSVFTCFEPGAFQ